MAGKPPLAPLPKHVPYFPQQFQETTSSVTPESKVGDPKHNSWQDIAASDIANGGPSCMMSRLAFDMRLQSPYLQELDATSHRASGCLRRARQAWALHNMVGGSLFFQLVLRTPELGHMLMQRGTPRLGSIRIVAWPPSCGTWCLRLGVGRWSNACRNYRAASRGGMGRSVRGLASELCISQSSAWLLVLTSPSDRFHRCMWPRALRRTCTMT